MKKILINGYFLCRNISGIERYAYEITNRLDSISSKNEISIIIPCDCKNIPSYKNLNIIIYKNKISNIIWHLFILQFFLFLNKKYIILDFSNTCLPFFPGIVFLHDIYCKYYPQDFKGLKNNIVRFYNLIQYWLIAQKAMHIATVSKFTKEQIITTYKIDPKRISVIYSSWDHFKSIDSDYSILNDFPVLSKPFYFCLGSLYKRKNIKWIIDYALKNPESLFALSGDYHFISNKSDLSMAKKIKNLIILGYINDNKVKALMEKCKAFILPSYYEGFGLTPLEALSCGARIIISNTASLPEIYENTAYYINPYNTDINLDDLLQHTVDNPQKILNKYSYDTSTLQLYKLIKKYCYAQYYNKHT